MTILFNDDSSQITWPTTDCHDINSKKYYSILYRPDVVERNKDYVKDVAIVIPTTSNGCMYVCSIGGITGSSEPIWPTGEGKTVVDGTVTWKSMPYSARLQSGDTLTTSTWTSDVGVTTSSPLILNNNRAMVRVDSVSVTTKTFSIKNHITITRSSGRIEEFDKTINITIKVL
jgi:hypothetical protein